MLRIRHGVWWDIYKTKHFHQAGSVSVEMLMVGGWCVCGVRGRLYCPAYFFYFRYFRHCSTNVECFLFYQFWMYFMKVHLQYFRHMSVSDVTCGKSFWAGAAVEDSLSDINYHYFVFLHMNKDNVMISFKYGGMTVKLFKSCCFQTIRYETGDKSYVRGRGRPPSQAA